MHFVWKTIFHFICTLSDESETLKIFGFRTEKLFWINQNKVSFLLIFCVSFYVIKEMVSSRYRCTWELKQDFCFKAFLSCLGWIGSTLFFLVCLAYPLAIFIRRHIGTRPMILCATFLIVLTFVSTPFMPNLNLIFLTFSIPFGIGSGVLECLSIVTLREHFDRNLGLATGIRSAWISTVGILYSYLLPIFFDAIGWRKTFFALSSLGAACVVYVIAYRDADFGKKTSEPSEKVNREYFLYNVSCLTYAVIGQLSCLRQTV